MDYWGNALDTYAGFYVLLRTTITNRLYEIVTFNRFFFKRYFGQKTCKRTKIYPSCNKTLKLAENFADKKRLTFYLSQVNEHVYKQKAKFYDWKGFKNLLTKDSKYVYI